MMRSLRRRLTLLVAGLAALVLTLALGAGLLVAWQRQNRAAQALFENNAQNLCGRLGEAASVADEWLWAQQRAFGGLLGVWDNGAPLRFTLLEQRDPDCAALFARAAGAAQGAGWQPGDTAARFVAYTVTAPDGQTWWGVTATVPRGRGTLTLTALHTAAPPAGAWVELALVYGGLWLAGAAVLAALSWALAGRLLAPTRRAWQRQNEFIAAAGHELRSPLAVIKASIAAAQDPDAGQAQRAGFLHTAQREADRLARLTGDLQVLAAGDAGALTIRPGPVAPDTLCIELYERYYLLARAQGRTLTLDLPAGRVPVIETDAGRLTQLLAVLMQNALDHTPPGTPVELALAVETGRRGGVRIAVTDHGPGIPDADKAKVFDRFFCADASRTRKENFGLGLSVARALARLLGAGLTLTDTPGGGATFTVTLRG